MNLTSLFLRSLHKRTLGWLQEPYLSQERVLKMLIERAQDTFFGKKYHFSKIRSYADFTQAGPLQEYEQLSPYVERITKGEKRRAYARYA